MAYFTVSTAAALAADRGKGAAMSTHQPGGRTVSRRQLLQWSAGALALPALTGIVSCGGSGKAAGDTLRIGWIRPTTGRLASTFAPLYVSGRIAVDEINEEGGILGKKLEIVEIDDQGSPAQQPAVARRLEQEGLQFVCGPVGTSQALASLAVTSRQQIIQTSYSNGAQLADGSKFPYHYQTTFNTDQQGVAVANYLARDLRISRVAIIAEDTEFGNAGLATSTKTLAEFGIQPTMVQRYPLDARNLDIEVRAMRDSGAEGVISWISDIPNGALAFNAMNALKWRPPVTGHTGLFLGPIFDVVPAEALRNVYGTYVRNLTWDDNEYPGDRAVAFADRMARYKEAKGLEPAIAAAPFYDFIHLLKMAIEQTDSTDAAEVKEVLDSLTGYDGLLGRISFTPEDHGGLDADAVVLASVVSAGDKKSKGVFRQRAPRGEAGS